MDKPTEKCYNDNECYISKHLLNVTHVQDVCFVKDCYQFNNNNCWKVLKTRVKYY